MSHLSYFSYPGFGQEALESTHYSQSVRLPSGGSYIQTSGQGGVDRFKKTSEGTPEISEDFGEEFEKALVNVDLAIKDAGGKGLGDCYKLVVYLVRLDAEKMFAPMIESLRQWFPAHKPLLTAVGLEKLAFPGMRVEVEGFAHVA